MALSSSSSSTIWRYHVFPSFHGPDVRKGFLSHLHHHFASKGIRTFKDQEIERGHTIGPELVQAIKKSRISIVVLSKKYASSRWCLDELVEIVNCKEAQGQIVMTIFYEVDPSDVRKQIGEFGSAFEKICQGKTVEVKLRWSKALAHVATIAGEHSLNWAYEAEMIQKIASDVSNKLSVTPSRDFEGMVGLEAHLTKLNTLLCLEYDEVKMIGIWGPAGIGKTTIARALFDQLSSSFQLKCFMGNLKGMGVDNYDSKLSLQNHLLSKILNQGDIRVHHLGAIKAWLKDQIVLIFLDDVDDLEQLEVLAKELSWFGSGSRIIVTTKDKKILKAHGIHDIYRVNFPSKEEALEILCRSAFKQSSVQDGFEELAKKVAECCGNLPSSLCFVGLSLRGESKHEWELKLSRIGGMVGLEAHLTKLNSLLCLELDEVKIIGLWGPAGIGKTTIARALFNQLYSSFKLKCFMGNLKGMGVDVHDSKLSLQNQLLCKILNQGDMRVHHFGVIKERLQDQRVLIILDDVDDLEQLEVLVKELSWFGSGSRIIVTTEDKKILKAHGIQDIYDVGFPSKEEALEILCHSAFKQSSVQDGFEELANKVAKFCGNLPLGLCVMGSSLRGESKHEWELQLSRIGTSLDRNIEDVLKVVYDRLSKKDQSLFLHIACFFKNEVLGHVISMFCHSKLDVGNGLKTLADKSLVHISTNGDIMMHHLLQQLGRQIVLEQSDEPGTRQFLIEAEEIRDVLTNKTGTSNMGEVSIREEAFEGMRYLRFLKIYYTLPPRLRLLHWDHYPRKILPPTFQTERLVKIHMQYSKLEKLWEGIQPLSNLKSIDLSGSDRLKEIPNLSNATNLETLDLWKCSSLVELPSSISNLHKLSKLSMNYCSQLRVIPTNINLASLEEVDMCYCSQLRSFPDISSNIKTLRVGDTKIEYVPPSVSVCWSRLEILQIGSISLMRLTHAPLSITSLDLSNSDMKRIPDCVISLPRLKDLIVESCRKLETIPALSLLLESLNANGCVSLQRLCFSFHNPTKKLTFCDCFYLDEEARRGIIQQSTYEYICLPGEKLPAEFTHKARGKSITIPLAPGTLSASSSFKACFRILPFKGFRSYRKPIDISCSLRSKGGVTFHSSKQARLSYQSLRVDHLYIFHGDLFDDEVDVTMSEIIFEFGCIDNDDRIIECGVQIRTESSESGSSSDESDNDDKMIECRIQIRTEEDEGSESGSSSDESDNDDRIIECGRTDEDEGSESGSSSDESDKDDKIIECGVQIMTEEAEGSSSSESDNYNYELLEFF